MLAVGAPRILTRLALCLACILGLSGCSIKKMAINQLGNALAGSGATFAGDEDPELIREAVPFSLKLIESLLAESPEHKGLLLAACSGFTQYGYAFVEQDADRVEDEDFEAAERLRLRARKLYLRARTYGLRGLDAKHSGFETALREDPVKAVQRLRKRDVPMVFWTAASWGAAIGISKDDPGLIGEQVIVEALIDRALTLEPDFDRGAIHSFLITYEMARQGGTGDPAARSRHHFEQAVALSDGLLASPYVSLAEAVSVQQNDPRGFKSLLEAALAIDPDRLPESRLVNLVFQERARWLLSRLDELFLITEEP